MARIVEHRYTPRKIFLNFHNRFQRWAILVVHRRGGKTVATINDSISRMMYFDGPPHLGGDSAPPGRYAYIAPFYNQAKQVAWDYVKSYTRSAQKKVSEGELSVTLFNDTKITLYGADNPDTFRGLYFDGAILDEFGMMKQSTWSEVILPTLVDRQGWATFIGTPNGPNHFRDLYQRALLEQDRWFVESHPVSQTNLLPDEELQEMKRLMTPEEYEQEMECSFEASTRGAFYTHDIRKATEEGRITQITTNRDLPLDFIFDLGYRDDTALLATQESTDGFPIMHAEANNLRPIKYYIQRIDDICAQHGTTRGKVWLPHDAKAKSLQTGRSIIEQFLDAGIRPHIVPKLDILDGIAAARFIFQEVWFNEPSTRDLINALQVYRREYDEDRKVFRNSPVHDWASHYADVFRYFALVSRKIAAPPEDNPPNKPKQLHYGFCLEDLYDAMG